MPPSPAFNNAAFALTKDNTISKVVELDNGVAVLHLAEIQPSDLRPLNEVRRRSRSIFSESKCQQAAQLKAQIDGPNAQGEQSPRATDFKTAAAAMNLKVETLPAFVPIKAAPSDPRLQTIAYDRDRLTPGQVSDPVPVQTDNTDSLSFISTAAPRPIPPDWLILKLVIRESQDAAIALDGLRRLGDLEEQAARHAQAAGARSVWIGGVGQA